MQNLKGNVKDRLVRYRQIKISVIGRKSGRTIRCGGRGSTDLNWKGVASDAGVKPRR